jgi:FtsP/CotA-like multicopper oxidase with cupredoxin domain
VDGADDQVGVADELVLVLSDIAIADGQLESPDSGGDLAAVFGREGTHVLVNGRTDARIVVRDGAPQRWRIVNAAKSRYFLLDLDGVPFTVIGGDGGLQESAVREDALTLTPGERLDLVVTPTRSAERPTLTLRSGLINRGFGSVEFRRVEQLMTVEFAQMPAYAGGVPPPPSRSIKPIAVAGATPVQIDLTFSNGDGVSRYGINGYPFGHEHMLRAEVGETQVWTVTNRTNWSHPFHLHGFFFQVLDSNGQPVRPLAWKDTVDVPFGETIKLAVRFDDRPGMWMYHCHILDHADLGMMGMLELVPATSSR